MGILCAFAPSRTARVLCSGVLLLLNVACGGSPTAPSNDPAGMPGAGGPTGVQLTDDFGGRRLFPDDNWWNADISGAPVDSQSSGYIDYIGRSRTSHPDFGPPPYGIPYVGVGGDQPRVPVTFTAYGSESDNGFGGEIGYPIPSAATTQPNYVEGGSPGGGTGGDRHLLIVDRDRWLLFELFAARWNSGAQRWGSGFWCGLQSRLECAPSGGVDICRCRRARDPARARAL